MFFFRGSALQVFGQVECNTMRTRFCETILRERIRKTETKFFEIRWGLGSRRAGRVREGGTADFGFWRGGLVQSKITFDCEKFS